jgi:transcriptional regulator with XRE-family HTH domain
MYIPNSALAYRIEWCREKLKLTPETVAERLGVSAADYADYEYGSQTPSEKSLLTLAKIFEVSYKTLIEGVENQYIELLNTFIRVSVIGEGFRDYNWLVSRHKTKEIVVAFFSEWLSKIKRENKPFYDEYLVITTLETLITLNNYYRVHFYDDSVDISVREPEIYNPFDFMDHLMFKIAFCAATADYLEQTDYKVILAEAEKLKQSKDLSAGQYFAVKVLVPYLSYIIHALKCARETSIDHFENLFFYGQPDVADWHEQRNM